MRRSGGPGRLEGGPLLDGLIDVHSHHYPDSYLAACRRPDSGLEHYVRDDGRLVVVQDGAVAAAVPQPLPPMDHRLALMDEAAVDIQVLSVSAPNVFRLPAARRLSLTRDLNDELDDLTGASGGRLRFFANLPLPDIDASLAELDRVLRRPRVVGVMLCTTVDRRTLDDPLLAPLWEELARREAVVFVHPTTACCTEGLRDFALSLALDFLAETTNAVGRLLYSGALERYRGIRWIFTHLGGTVPFVFHRFDNYAGQFPECRRHITAKPSAQLRELFFDTVSTHPAAMRCAFETLPVSQFVFGTDYPHVPGALGVFVETLEAAGLSPDDLARVRRHNAAALLGLG
ncbi:MAG: amidohydrolase [Acidimicrobiia bacterium]|nr:amidohydrolase [Acidimicrobiia bacterium]